MVILVLTSFLSGPRICSGLRVRVLNHRSRTWESGMGVQSRRHCVR